MMTPMMNASQPLEIAAAMIIATMPIADRQEPAHRIAPGMQEPAECADDGPSDDEPDPVHVRCSPLLGASDR